MLALGPVAEQLGKSFDRYWNNQLSVPIQHFLWWQPKPRQLDKARQQLSDYLQQAKQENSEQYQRLMQYKQRPQLQQWLDELVWAPGRAMWDAPEKLLAEGVPAASLLLTTQLAPTMQAVSSELTLVSAYFVPTDSGVDYLADRTGAGVTVRILTNSLEATDVPAVHGGYAPYREAMLELGVRLFELRRQPEQEASYSFLGESESSLHSKAAVFDQQKVFIGSLNLDPRSVLWNTEVGILVESHELAREVHRLTLEGMSPALSYEVRLVERDGHLIYNVAVLIGPDGEVAGKYRKICLPRGEVDGGFTPGEDYPVFDTRFGRVGLMVCYDGFFPEIARELANRGAEVIGFPVMGCNPLLAAARAAENHVFVVSSTHTDAAQDWMVSAVFGRDGRRLAEARDWGTVVVTEVDLGAPLHWNSLGDFRAELNRQRP